MQTISTPIKCINREAFDIRRLLVLYRSWGKQHIMSEPTQENIVVVEEPTETTAESSVKRKKSGRQKRQSLQARIKCRQQAIHCLRQHLKKGTVPKRFKALRPYPKMDSPESQAIVNAACGQVHCVILNQMVIEEEKKLKQDETKYQTMKKQHLKITQTLKKPTVLQLQQELKDLQSKVTWLCSQRDITQ